MDGYGPHNQFDHHDLPAMPQSGDWRRLPNVPIYGEDIPGSAMPASDALADIDTSGIDSEVDAEIEYGTPYGEITDPGTFEEDGYDAEIEGYEEGDFPYDGLDSEGDGATIDWDRIWDAHPELFDEVVAIPDDAIVEYWIGDAALDGADVTTDATDAPAETTEMLIDYGEAPTEVDNLYQKLQDRLAASAYTDDGHYLEMDTPSGSVTISDQLRHEHATHVEAYLEAQAAGQGFDAKTWSESLLRSHAGVLCISIQDGPLDELTTDETEQYILARPCDLNPDDDSPLGSLVAETLAEQAPDITMDSTKPVMLNIVSEPTRIFTGVGHDTILEELYNLLRQE